MTATLTRVQQGLLNEWLPEAQVVADRSWGLVGTTVLELESGSQRYIAKAGDAADHHLAREIEAHRRWVNVWAQAGRAPRLVNADVDAKILLTEYLLGDLIEGRSEEWQPDVHRQAGQLLAQFHAQYAEHDDGSFERAQRADVLRWLSRPHHLSAATAAAIETMASSWPIKPTMLVPTHGDWQPRNWLIDGGRVSIIDFGRAALRPAATDFGRLANQQWREHPELEAAFVEGYGTDPRQPEAWLRNRVLEAVSTAAWALQVGAADYEQQGLRLVAELAAELGLPR